MEGIGTRLRAAREARGITLFTVEEETKIRRKYIEALEAGRRSDLPGDVYLKGFLRTYGNYLGLNGDALVDEYKRATRPPQGAASPAAALSQLTATTAEAMTKEPSPNRARTAAAAQEAGTPLPPRRWSIAVLLGAVLAGIAYLGWMIALQFRPTVEPVTSAPPLMPKADAAANSQAPAPKLPDVPKVQMAYGSGEEVLFSVPAQEADVKLEFTPGVLLWMRALVDGKQVYEGFPGESLSFKGKKIQLRMGHMRGVSLVVNGQRFEKPLDGGPFTLFVMAQ